MALRQPKGSPRLLGFESLEDRCNPAGLVTAQLLLDGTLQITGNGADNAIGLSTVGADIVVTGFATAVNGSPSKSFPNVNVTKIDVALAGGDDYVEFVGVTVASDMVVTDDAGNDTVIWDSSASTSGIMSATTGKGGDFVLFLDSTAGAMVAVTGNGADSVYAIGNTGSQMLIDTGAGGDVVDIETSTFGAFQVNTGDGADTIVMLDISSLVLQVSAGNGADSIYAGGVFTYLGTVDGGGGGDVYADLGGNFGIVTFNIEGFI